ncbi:MAG: maleylacetoacetate isomerase [Litorimonas sp.]
MMTLYGYWRSSASYRVRIALALKGVVVNYVAVNLREDAQKSSEHLSKNPQGFVPVLELEDGTQLNQSLAILEYLEAIYPAPALLPNTPVLRAKLHAASLMIAADISPIQNLSVLKYIRAEYHQDDAGVTQWAAHWIVNGFTALEALAQKYETSFFMTETPSLFECCLVPQAYNARRFGVNMGAFPRLSAIDAKCRKLPAFISAVPENQADAI